MTERDESSQTSRDEDAVGWGDDREERGVADADVERLLAERPPHHDAD